MPNGNGNGHDSTTKLRQVAVMFCEYLEPGFDSRGRPTRVRRMAYRGDVIAVPPGVEARMDAKGSLTPANWPMGEEGKSLIERAMQHKRAQYVSARQTIEDKAQ